MSHYINTRGETQGGNSEESTAPEAVQPLIIALDGFTLETRTKSVLTLLAPVTPSNYQVMPSTDMMEGKGGICFRKDTKISSEVDSQLKKVLKFDD